MTAWWTHLQNYKQTGRFLCADNYVGAVAQLENNRSESLREKTNMQFSDK